MESKNGITELYDAYTYKRAMKPTTEDERAAAEKREQARSALFSVLSEKQKAVFQDYDALYTQKYAEERRRAFEAGFKTAVRLIAEGLEK